MGKKLYVGNISYKATEDDLREAFEAAGGVESVKIITDTYTGQPKGFGFIEMASEEEAKQAITNLNGSTFMERTIVVNEARPQKPKERKGFGRGRGAYDSGRGNSGRGRGTGQRRGRR